MTFPFIQGFGVGAGLIMAIGAQNAFVLSQGVRKQYHWVVALICSLCDGLLIIIGVTGVGAAIAGNPSWSKIAAWGGAAFLVYYGFNSLRSAFRGGSLKEVATTDQSLKAVVMATLAITLLNPHVYLDTVILLGSISSQFQGTDRYLFGMGAVTASFTWFFALSFGGRLLAPVFLRPIAWKVLDLFVWGVMWTIAFKLVQSDLSGLML